MPRSIRGKFHNYRPIVVEMPVETVEMAENWGLAARLFPNFFCSSYS